MISRRFAVNARMLRFAAVGICNAIISFSLLNVSFYYFGINKLLSSIIATSCALLFSFALNRNFVFLDKRRASRQFTPFVLVTISGSLGVLNLIYIISVAILARHDLWMVRLVKGLTGKTIAQSFIQINLSTVFGAIGSMIWNYNGYRWFVFRTPNESSIESNEAAPA
jgi:putative flippase GtrA